MEISDCRGFSRFKTVRAGEHIFIELKIFLVSDQRLFVN